MARDALFVHDYRPSDSPATISDTVSNGAVLECDQTATATTRPSDEAL